MVISLLSRGRGLFLPYLGCAAAAAGLSGCAALVEHPDSIVPTAIPPALYASATCEELKAAQLAVWKRKEDVRIPLKRAAEDFAILAGTNEHSELKGEYADLQGRLRALDVVAFNKTCQLAPVESLKAAYGLDGNERPSWPSRNPKVS